MKEIEVKILEIDRKEIEKKLRSIGAKKVSDVIMEVYSFDFPGRSIKKAKNLLRMRREGDKTKITFKKKISTNKVKMSHEYETEVLDMGEMRKILEYLGLKVYLCVKKRRITYMLGKTHFEIDKYLGKYSSIPEFLEIEAKDAKTIYKYAKLLGFRKEQCKPSTGYDLMKYYSRK